MEKRNKLIVKNTFILYFRLIFILAVNLITYRLVLKALGVEDYGLYNVVGGIVSLFTILNGTLSSGSSRFITFELGKGDFVALKQIFSVSFTLHLCIALIVFILLETIGLWYINFQLVLPPDRVFAANWVFQFSVITCMLNLTQVPYSSLIIAHERMDIYAYVGIAEVVFKLILVGLLFVISGVDKLIFYGGLLFVWSISLQLYYRFFCYKRFPESHLNLVRDKSKYKQFLNFSLWDIIGTFTVQGNAQGVNLMINAFFGLVYNASFGLSNQIKGILSQFSSNFLTAVTPQITKSYAENDINRFNSLLNNSSKMSFVLFSLVAIPVYFEADYLIGLWLAEVPSKTPLFLQLTILNGLLRALAQPLVNGIHATGNIKNINLWGGGVSVLLTLPLTYVLYRLGFAVEYTFYITLFVSCLANIIEIFSLKHEDKSFRIRKYLLSVYLPCFAMFFIIYAILTIVINTNAPSFGRLICVCCISTLLIGGISFLIILSKNQKRMVINKLHSIITVYR